jgi:hypothetical protein
MRSGSAVKSVILGIASTLLLSSSRLASQTAPAKSPAPAGKAAAGAKSATPDNKPTPTTKPKPATCSVGQFTLHFQTGTTTMASVAKVLDSSIAGITVTVEASPSTALDVEDVKSDPATCKDLKSPIQGSLKAQIEAALSVMDRIDIQPAILDLKYLIQVKNLGANHLTQDLPAPTPAFHFAKISPTFLLPIPVDGVQSTPASDAAAVAAAQAALLAQGAKIKQDIEALDDQYGQISASAKPSTVVTDAGLAAWMAKHTIALSILDPRDAIVAFQDRFQGQHFSLVPIASQRAVAIVPADTDPTNSTWRKALALERSLLYKNASQAKQEAASSAGSEGPAPANASKQEAAPSAGSGGPAPANASNTGPDKTPGRIVRLYHLREADTIAAAINKMHGGNLVVNIDKDQILILPTPAGQTDQTDEIRRLMAILDLPRPQVSLEAWSYQISSSPKDASKQSEDVRKTFEEFLVTLDKTNESLTSGLAAGIRAIENDARKDGYFDQDFQGYLTKGYGDCIGEDHYCLGYANALQIPVADEKTASTNASLNRFLLLLAAAKDDKIKGAISDMKSKMLMDQKDSPPFTRFLKQLDVWSDPSNLHAARAAILEFLFQYKMATSYANDFSPYDLQQAVHALDNILSPVMDAFTQDTDDFIEKSLAPPSPGTPPATTAATTPAKHHAKNSTSSALFGKVGVTAISGTPAAVTGKVVNYFDVTQPPTLSDVLNNSSGTAGAGLATALANVLTPKEITIAQFIANANTQPKVYAQVGKDASLTITPVSLDDASAAELDVSFEVNDDGSGPATVNQSTNKTDLLDRVSDHKVTDHVRVESFKLFQISTFGMQLEHESQKKCWSYSPFCVAWKAVFGSIPAVGDFFEVTPQPQVTDNRSIAVVRAMVVPTAMDLGLTVRFDTDHIYDPVMKAEVPVKSVSQLNGNIFGFHKEFIKCMIQDAEGTCLGKTKLSAIQEDISRE